MPTHVPVFIGTTLLLAMLPGVRQALMVRQVLEGGNVRSKARSRATPSASSCGQRPLRPGCPLSCWPAPLRTPCLGSQGVLWALVSASWYMVFTWAVGRGRDLVSQPTVLRGLGVMTGVVLVGLGAAVAAGV